MNERYDIIGDIHGYATKLEALLRKLGYEEKGGAFKHSERTAIFVGDFIDRGPQIRRTLQIVRAMVDEGGALAVMGNHEFNALAYHAPDGAGGWLREHSVDKMHQHAETVRQLVEPHPEEWQEWLEWFSRLPLALNLGTLRIVHAAWNQAAVEAWLSRPSLQISDLRRMVTKGSPENRIKEILLNGLEITLPEGHFYSDKSGFSRDKIRTRWWLEIRDRTYREVVFPDSESVPHLAVPAVAIPNDHAVYPESAPPVFVGHYWLPAGAVPTPVASNVACLDYSVAKGGGLVAYRFDGEQTLKAEKFEWVP